MIDPNMGLKSSQIPDKLWDREQSGEQLRSIMELISIDNCSFDRSTENPHTAPRTLWRKLKQYHIKAILAEFVLHNEAFHIVLGLFLSLLGWAFELSSNGSSMNMFNFIALTIYLPIFLKSNVSNNRTASLTKAFKRNGRGRFSQICPLKDIMIQPKSQAIPMENTEVRSLPQTTMNQPANLLAPEDTLPVPIATGSQQKSSKATEEPASLGTETFPVYNQSCAFQAWKPTRLQKYSASLIDMESNLHSFILKSFGSFLAKIRNVSPPNYLVIRDGEFMVAEACKLVVGDVLILTEGQIVPCDCTILPTYFTQASSLSAHLLENQMHCPVSSIDISSRLRTFCPEAVSYGLARNQPSVYCVFPTDTAARIITHYKIHSAYSALRKSGMRHIHRKGKARLTDSSSTVHTVSLFHPDISEEVELLPSRVFRLKQKHANSVSSLLDSTLRKGRPAPIDTVSDSVLDFYINEIGLQSTVQNSSLLCGYKISQIKNAIPILLENVSVSIIVSTFIAHIHEECQTTDTDLSTEKFNRLSALCMKILIDDFGAKKTSSSSVSIYVTKGIQVSVTALGRDTSVFQRSERLLNDLQQAQATTMQSSHGPNKSTGKLRRARRNVSNPATIIEGKEALTETISMPASFLSSTFSMQSFLRIISIISLWISALLIVAPVLPRVILSTDLRSQYVDYWDPARSNQLALFTIGFIPSFCAALTFGLVSGLFLHRNIVSLRPIISVSSKHLLSLLRRNVHIHTLGALEAVGFTNALVIDESLLVNISGSQVHADAPGFWGPVTLNLSFIYVAGENTAHRLYLDDEIRLQGSILAQDIVTPLWPSVFKHLVQVDALTGQYVIIGARKRFRRTNTLQHSKGIIESTEHVEQSHQLSFHEGQSADIIFIRGTRASKVSKQSKQPKRLHDTLLCLMRFLACVTMEPADVAHVLKKSNTDQSIFTSDYAFEIIPLDSDSVSSHSTSRDHSFHEQKDLLYVASKQCAYTNTSSEMSLVRSPPLPADLSLSRPIRPESSNSVYFMDSEEYLCKYLSMKQSLTLKTIRTSQHSATTRKYGRLITSGCLQDSHLSVSQVHPLLTEPLSLYLVYIERHTPVVVVKSSSPGDLISACNYVITDTLSPDVNDKRYRAFTLTQASDTILFYYQRMTAARRQLASQQINELGSTCHELVVYAISALDGDAVDLSSLSRQTAPALDLIYIGAMGFHATQKRSPAAFISRFTDLANGANLVITTRRSSNATQQQAATGVCKLKEIHRSYLCLNPITNMQTLLTTLNLTAHRNTNCDTEALEEVRDSDWVTSNAEIDRPRQDINISTVELRPLLSKIPTRARKTKGAEQKQSNIIAPSAIQTKRCFVTTDLKAVSLYTLSRVYDNNGKLLLPSRPNRKHKRHGPKSTPQHQAAKIATQDGALVEEPIEYSTRYSIILSDTEEEQESSQQDSRIFRASVMYNAKYQQRSVQLAQNRKAYALIKATNAESVIFNESFASDEIQTHSMGATRDDVTIYSADDILGYPIIAPQQTWKAVEHFMTSVQKFYYLPKRSRRGGLARDGELLGEYLPNIFIIPESNPVDVASVLSNAGAFVSLVLPSRPSSCAHTVEEEEIFKDNATVDALLQTAGDSRAVPSYLSVYRDSISFSRKPDFLVIGYSPGHELKHGQQQLGIPRESYVQLRRLLKERISVAYTFGRHGLQHIRDISLESPHFFLSMFPVFIGAVRSNLLQGIFPLTLMLTIIINITLECVLYKYEMINLGLRPWYYPPTTVGIILLTNALVNDFMIPKVLQLSLKLHGKHTRVAQVENKLWSNSFTRSRPLVTQMIDHIRGTVMRTNHQRGNHVHRRAPAYMRQPPNRYHLEALMNVAKKLSKNLRTSSLITFVLVFIIISTIALIPSINYRYYGSYEFFKSAYFDAGGLFASSLSLKFVAFTTLLMVLLFMSFSISAFFITMRLPILRSAEDSVHRCFRVLRVGIFFSIQFLVIYIVLLLPVRFPVLSLFISGFKISEETSDFWSSVFLSAGISCLVLVGIILEQSIPILE